MTAKTQPSDDELAKKLDAFRLIAAYDDYFTIRGGVVNLSFTRDDKGKIAGFVFNAAADGRDVKGIVFKRQ